jgi:hypothetical protein
MGVIKSGPEGGTHGLVVERAEDHARTLKNCAPLSTHENRSACTHNTLDFDADGWCIAPRDPT